MDAHADAMNNIQKLENLPVELSSEMTHAIELFRSLGPIDEPAIPDWSKVKPKDAPAKYREYLHELTVYMAQKEQQNHFQSSLARYVNRCYAAERDRLFDPVSELFAPAAERYAEAVHGLPDALSETSLVNAGSRTLASFEQAQQAAADMKQYVDFVGSIEGSEGNALVVCEPESWAQLQKLTRPGRSASTNKVHPVFFAAVKDGLDLELHTKAQQKALFDQLKGEAKQQGSSRSRRGDFTRGAFIAR